MIEYDCMLPDDEARRAALSTRFTMASGTESRLYLRMDRWREANSEKFMGAIYPKVGNDSKKKAPLPDQRVEGQRASPRGGLQLGTRTA